MSYQQTSIPFWVFFKSVIRPFYWCLAGFVLVAVIWAADMSLRPYVIKVILNRLADTAPQDAYHYILWPAVIYVALSLLVMLTFRLYDFIVLKLNPCLKQHVIEKMVAHMLGHSHEFYQNNFTGALSNKISDVSNGIRDIISIFFDRFFALTLGLSIALYTLYSVNFKFALTLFIWLIFFVSIAWLYGRKAHQLSDDASEINSTMIGKIVDILSNITSVRFFGGQTYEKKYLNHWTTKEVKAEQKLGWFLLKLWFIQGFSIIAMEAVCIWLLIEGRKNNTVTLGDFALIFAITVHIIESTWNLAKDMTSFTEYLGKITQGLRLTTKPHDIQDIPNAQVLKVPHGEIRFDKVHFKFPQQEPLFSNKSVIIHPGQKVGLVGYSGSGKSTFVSLILRVFELQSGKILIDGQNIADVSQESLRNAIGMIPQDPVLFHRTLAENIQYGNLKTDQRAVIEAAKKSHADEFITALPDGYNSLVGERGIKLSGGQRQRIAIARAILKNAPILILDEATSALDSVTETLIQESFLDLMQNKTTLVVAHRLSTLLHMDRILVFDQGKIVEDGTHKSLLAKHGRYQTLWDAQVGGFLPEGNTE